MQLDFFHQLTAFTARLLAPREKTTSAPAATTAPPLVGSAADLEEHARRLLRGVQCPALAAKVRVVWNPRMRSTAGTAHSAQSLVTLNPRLCAFGQVEVDRTLRHELAHLLAHHRAGRRRIAAHGPEWRQACIDLGLPDEKRCHDLPLPRRTQRVRHFYRCPCCRVEFARVRPLRRRSACLACCRKHNRGRYDDRFRFEKLPAPERSI